MTIYVPTLLLNIIALATNYFKVIVFVFVLLNIIALASNYTKAVNLFFISFKSCQIIII